MWWPDINMAIPAPTPFSVLLPSVNISIISITLYFPSLNLILLSVNHAVILFISTLEMFSDSPIDSAFIITIKSFAKATTFEWFVYLILSSGLYCIFQNPGPQHDHCGGL